MNRNMRYLQCVIETDNWTGLRRQPSVYVGEPDSSESMQVLVAELRDAVADQQVA